MFGNMALLGFYGSVTHSVGLLSLFPGTGSFASSPALVETTLCTSGCRNKSSQIGGRMHPPTIDKRNSLGGGKVCYSGRCYLGTGSIYRWILTSKETELHKDFLLFLTGS